jgi:DNA-directed RNA polymerase specialized sigma24 family protein
VIVREAVDALPPPHRQALRLAFLGDLTHEQVADFLYLPGPRARPAPDGIGGN